MDLNEDSSSSSGSDRPDDFGVTGGTPSLETPMTPWEAPVEWYRFLQRSMTQLPPPNDPQHTEREAVMANKKPKPEDDQILTICKEDFIKGGKYAHLHIPKYPSVPNQIMIDFGITTE